jgi:hypothetical protein
MEIRIAIDPGKSGGVAWSVAGEFRAAKAPESLGDRLDLLKRVVAEARSGTEHPGALVEAVHGGLFAGAGPRCPVCGRARGMGAVSAFSFGEDYGRWLGLLSGLGVPVTLVTPQAWMKRVGNLPAERADRKKRLKEMAQLRFPHLKVTLATADALMMLASAMLLATATGATLETPVKSRALALDL